MYGTDCFCFAGGSFSPLCVMPYREEFHRYLRTRAGLQCFYSAVIFVLLILLRSAKC